MPAALDFQHALGLAVKARRRELGITQETLANEHRVASALDL
jgi:predicted transcriptional regulator